jgi:hypothetical protein
MIYDFGCRLDLYHDLNPPNGRKFWPLFECFEDMMLQIFELTSS